MSDPVGMASWSRNDSGIAVDAASAEGDADGDADDGAEEGHDRRLPPDHPPGLAARHADRTQQAELPGALEDRQRQRVADAEHGDHHGEQQQDVDGDEDLVELRLLAGQELAAILDVDLRERRRHPFDRRRSPLGRDTVGHLREHEVVRLVGEVGIPRRVRDQVVPGERGVAVDAGDGERRLAGPAELHVDDVARRRVRGRSPGPRRP